LASRLEKEAGLGTAYPVEANAVFVSLPKPLFDGLRERGWMIYNFIGGDTARLMCSWQTTEADIDALLRDIRELGSLRRS
jgi:threonine aldolase